MKNAVGRDYQDAEGEIDDAAVDEAADAHGLVTHDGVGEREGKDRHEQHRRLGGHAGFKAEKIGGDAEQQDGQGGRCGADTDDT